MQAVNTLMRQQSTSSSHLSLVARHISFHGGCPSHGVESVLAARALKMGRCTILSGSLKKPPIPRRQSVLLSLWRLRIPGKPWTPTASQPRVTTAVEVAKAQPWHKRCYQEEDFDALKQKLLEEEDGLKPTQEEWETFKSCYAQHPVVTIDRLRSQGYTQPPADWVVDSLYNCLSDWLL